MLFGALLLVLVINGVGYLIYEAVGLIEGDFGLFDQTIEKVQQVGFFWHPGSLQKTICCLLASVGLLSSSLWLWRFTSLTRLVQGDATFC